MKTKIKLIAGICCFCISFTNAQFLPFFPGGTGLYTTTTNQVVGVGDFLTAGGLNFVQAKLHVNAFYLATSTATPFVDNGELFRTDGDNLTVNQWMMFTGGTAATTTMKGRIFVPTLSNTFAIEATHGALQFNTDTTKRMTITQKGNVVIYNSIVLKATDGNNYFMLTLNNKGEIKVTPVDMQTL